MSKINFPIDLFNFFKSKEFTMFENYKMNSFVHGMLNKFIPEIFKDELLKELLEVAYLASTQTDEGRSLKFKIVYSSHDLENLYTAISKESKSFFRAVHFTKPRDYTVQEIRKLAVCNYDSTGILCEWNKTKSKLQITGFMHYLEGWNDTMNAYSDALSFYYGHLLFNVRSPGNIDVYLGTLLLGGLKNGQLRSPLETFSKEMFPIGKLCDQAIKDFHKHFYSLEQHIEIKQYKRDFWDYMNILAAIINGIVELGHGGSIVFYDHNQKKELFSHVKPKYRIKESSGLKRGYISLVNSRRKPGPDNSQEKDAAIKLTQSELMKQCKFISGLSSVDGAILLSNHFRLEGFSSELRPLKMADKVLSYNVEKAAFMSLPEYDKFIKGDKVDVEQVGMRHRSAFNLCHSINGIFVFVISQDGGVSLIWGEKGVVKMLKDIRVTNIMTTMVM